jgi:TRAP-type C4-dicarboxylate transport system permease small subunit
VTRTRGLHKERAVRLLAHIPECVAGTCMLAITLILFAGVIWRYFLVNPLTWTDEVARMLFVWLGFIGAAVGVKAGLHASVSILAHRLPPAWRRIANLLSMLVVAIVALVLVVVGAKQTIESFKHEIMPVTGISNGWSQLAVPIAGLLILAYVAIQVRLVLRRSSDVEATAVPE